MEVSFQEKQLSDYHTIILVSFPLDWCVDEIVDRYDDHFFWCHTFAVKHSANGEEGCWIIITNIFDVQMLKHSWWYKC